jgi:hypothetical protein
MTKKCGLTGPGGWVCNQPPHNSPDHRYFNPGTGRGDHKDVSWTGSTFPVKLGYSWQYGVQYATGSIVPMPQEDAEIWAENSRGALLVRRQVPNVEMGPWEVVAL